jgi:hypothetical protein
LLSAAAAGFALGRLARGAKEATSQDQAGQGPPDQQLPVTGVVPPPEEGAPTSAASVPVISTVGGTAPPEADPRAPGQVPGAVPPPDPTGMAGPVVPPSSGAG